MAESDEQTGRPSSGTPAPVTIQRPRRWDVPFGADMTDADVEHVLSISPFDRMRDQKFPASATLHDILRNDSRVLRLARGDIVVRQGDYGNSAFFILRGTVRVVTHPPLPASVLGRRPSQRKGLFGALAQLWQNPRLPEVRDVAGFGGDERVGARRDVQRMFLQDVPGVLERHETATVFAGQAEQGDLIGEMAALGRIPRTATVFADDDTELLEIRWQGLRDIMRRTPALREHIHERYRHNMLQTSLRATPIFGHLDDDALGRVADASNIETFESSDWFSSFRRLADMGTDPEDEPIIVEEGHYANGIIILLSGFARLSRKLGHGYQTISYLGKGQHHGLDEIHHNWSHSHERVALQSTLRAVGYVDVLRVPTQVLEEHVLRGLPDDLRPRPIVQADPPAETPQRAKPTQPVNTDLLEFLVERRFVNGTASMLIDLDRCTRCDDCVRACAVTHDNNPRFIRHGPRHDNLMVANACMHCVDPICMIECPTGAIHRDLDRGQVVINDVTCIGCGSCARNCPYDNIRMVEIRDDRGQFVLDESTNRPILKATKCDLCVDQLGGPACERACPHDALVRIDMSDEKRLAEWLHR